MYINFEQLMSSDMSFEDVAYLLLIRQKDELADSIPEEKIKLYEDRGLVERQKNGKMKMSPRGGSFLTMIETPGLTPEIEGLRDSLLGMYSLSGKEAGSMKDMERRLIWFMSNTNFKPRSIIGVVNDYLGVSGDYTMRLDNLIWKPANVYSVHMSLAESKMFDLMCKRYDLNSDMYFRENQNKEIMWMFAVSRLPSPPARMDAQWSISGDVKRDMEKIDKIKKELGRRLKL